MDLLFFQHSGIRPVSQNRRPDSFNKTGSSGDEQATRDWLLLYLGSLSILFVLFFIFLSKMSTVEPDMEDLFEEKKRVRNPLVPLGLSSSFRLFFWSHFFWHSIVYRVTDCWF